MSRPDYNINDLRKCKVRRISEGSLGLWTSLRYLEEKHDELNSVRLKGLPYVNKLLMDYGNTLGVFPKEWKTKNNKVIGCSSNVYIAAMLANGRMFYAGDSDSKIVRGEIALLVNGMNRLTPEDIVNNSDSCISDFVRNSKVRFSLTVSRTSSLGKLFQFMKKKAEAFLE